MTTIIRLLAVAVIIWLAVLLLRKRGEDDPQ